jgi:hypothetical protein
VVERRGGSAVESGGEGGLKDGMGWDGWDRKGEQTQTERERVLYNIQYTIPATQDSLIVFLFRNPGLECPIPVVSHL